MHAEPKKTPAHEPAGRVKRAYISPKLTTHGSVGKLTQHHNDYFRSECPGSGLFGRGK